MGRIIDKINERRKHYQQATQQLKDGNNHNKKEEEENGNNYHSSSSSLRRGWYFSFEFFPPKTEAGFDNLLTRIDRMTTNLNPLFINVTWGGDESSARTLSIASHAQHYFGVDVLLHLTTTTLHTREQIEAILNQAKCCGIHNLLLLRGDPPHGSWKKGEVSSKGYCPRAIDLVRLVRELHGSYFGIAVAGHPEGHPSSYSMEDEMKHLKEKIHAGADLIITQFFYDVSYFLQYVKRCREHGITCPILPGIMPIQSYLTFVRMTQFCNVAVPSSILRRLAQVKEDDEAVKRIGCDIASDMCRTILSTPEEDGGVDGIHFYTLNLERSVTTILMDLGAIIELVSPSNTTNEQQQQQQQGEKEGKQHQSSSSSLSLISQQQQERPLPWRPSAMARRANEGVRPIHWANRPKSYLMRTDDWDEFPNGRWGDSSSPAFGELSNVSHFYTFTLGSEDDRRAMLGSAPSSFQDVYEIFARYVEGKVPHLPWCETPLQLESFTIQRQLALLNRAGFLTINSQPPVNGLPSTHRTFGWGGAGGYVYQKAYCECFVDPSKTKKLIDFIQSHCPSMTLYAVNNLGEELGTNRDNHYGSNSRGGLTALTWGVFPDREIVQPTIFDPKTFLVWAEEAFSLWTGMWLNLYDPESESYELIETIRDTYYLVAIIDNDYESTKAATSTTTNCGGDDGMLWNTVLNVGGVDL